MNHTDRYLQIPALKTFSLESNNEDGVTINAQILTCESFMCFSVHSIVAYGPDNNVQPPEEEGDPFPFTVVHLKDGISFVSPMSVAEFEDLVNSHYDKINKF